MIDENQNSFAIARANPVILIFFIAAMTYALVGSIGTLQDSGWMNSEAFFKNHEVRGRKSPFSTIPWFGHFSAAAVAIGLAHACGEFVRLSLARFHAITFDGKYISQFGVFKPVRIERDLITSARLVSWVANLRAIEISHLTKPGSEKITKEYLIMAVQYRESAKTIAANLAACGVPMAPLSDDVVQKTVSPPSD